MVVDPGALGLGPATTTVIEYALFIAAVDPATRRMVVTLLGSTAAGTALNRALHTIAATRMRSCPTTQAYVARRTAEGKNPGRSDAASSGTSPASSTAP